MVTTSLGDKDKNQQDPNATEKFQSLQEAYEALLAYQLMWTSEPSWSDLTLLEWIFFWGGRRSKQRFSTRFPFNFFTSYSFPVHISLISYSLLINLLFIPIIHFLFIFLLFSLISFHLKKSAKIPKVRILFLLIFYLKTIHFKAPNHLGKGESD